MSGIFTNGQSLVVTTTGPGRLHLLSYQSNGGVVNVVGFISTGTRGETRFLISHSYTFERFAFYWDGAGEAVYGIGASLFRRQVGNNWSNASVASWGSPTITTEDVSVQLKTAVNRDNQITAFIIPDLI